MIPDSPLEAIATVFSILSDLRDVTRRSVRLGAEPIGFEPGDVLFDIGDGCDDLGMIVAGRIRVSAQSRGGRELVLYRVNPSG